MRSARLFLNDPDGQGTYEFQFQLPEWFEVQLTRWMATHRAGWAEWAGFCLGCEQKLADIKKAEAMGASFVREPEE